MGVSHRLLMILERIRFLLTRSPRGRAWAASVAVATAYALLALLVNAGRTTMAYDDAVLELSIEARSGVDAPYLEGSRFSSYRRIDVYGELIRGLNHLTGDRTCSRRILLGAITFLTVLGAFHFCHGLLDRTGLACVGAVLLALPRHSLGADFWGILDLEHVLPRSLYTPVFFPVLLGFIRHLDTPRGVSR